MIDPLTPLERRLLKALQYVLINLEMFKDTMWAQEAKVAIQEGMMRQAQEALDKGHKSEALRLMEDMEKFK